MQFQCGKCGRWQPISPVHRVSVNAREPYAIQGVPCSACGFKGLQWVDPRTWATLTGRHRRRRFRPALPAWRGQLPIPRIRLSALGRLVTAGARRLVRHGERP